MHFTRHSELLRASLELKLLAELKAGVIDLKAAGERQRRFADADLVRLAKNPLLQLAQLAPELLDLLLEHDYALVQLADILPIVAGALQQAIHLALGRQAPELDVGIHRLLDELAEVSRVLVQLV